jgi:hypothetical protein
MGRIYNLESLTDKLHSDVIGKWHNEARHGNDGSAGNTLEDLLGITENNLKLPDWGNIELKTKKKESASLVTLLHREPSPNASIPKLLLSMGWKHGKAGLEHPKDEMSFRSTTRANSHSDRGLAIGLQNDRIELLFDPTKVATTGKDRTGAYPTYGDWLADIQTRTPHFNDTLPVYWERSYIEKEIQQKLDQTLFVICESRVINNKKQFRYSSAVLLKGFVPEKMSELFASKSMYVDFDARTRHNHGTKFRVGLNHIPKLFAENIEIY